MGRVVTDTHDLGRERERERGQTEQRDPSVKRPIQGTMKPTDYNHKEKKNYLQSGQTWEAFKYIFIQTAYMVIGQVSASKDGRQGPSLHAVQ